MGRSIDMTPKLVKRSYCSWRIGYPYMLKEGSEYKEETLIPRRGLIGGCMRYTLAETQVDEA